MNSNQSTHNQRGVTALEFTIIAPLVFVLIFGMIEFGCYFYDRALITNACREGARAGVVFVPHQTLGDVTARVTAAVNYYLGVDPSPWPKLIYFGSPTPAPQIPQPTIITGTNGSNDILRVEVKWRYDFLVLPNFKNLGWGGLDSTMDINAVSEMMLELNVG